VPIKPASEINWKPPPRCPVCNDGILPSGRSMPFVVDGEGRVYCRRHGGEVEASYPAKLAEYEAWRKRRADAIDALQEEARTAAEPKEK